MSETYIENPEEVPDKNMLVEDVAEDVTEDDMEESFDDSDDEEDIEYNEHEVFPGDTGELPLEVRNVLIALIKNPLLKAEKNIAVWRTFMNNRKIITSRLNDLLMGVEVDINRGVAWTTQIESDTSKMLQLGNNRRLSAVQTAVYYFVASHARAAELRGEDVITMTLEEIMDQMKSIYKRTTNYTKFEGEVKRTLTEMGKADLVSVSKNDQFTYVIDPVVSVVMNLDTLHSLEKQIDAILHGAGIQLNTEENEDDNE